MTMVPELQPEELEVLQAEDPGVEPIIRVEIARVEVPIRTQDLPRKAGGTIQKTVGIVPIQLLASDHRRASARVMSVGQNMYVAYSAQTAQDVSRMALWPANVPFPMSVDSALWVASTTATTVISVITEMWATGE